MTAALRSRPAGRLRSVARLRPAARLLPAALLCAAARLWYLGGPAAQFNADEATTGLMVREILAGRHYVFYAGQDYGGTLEQYLQAAAYLLVPMPQTAWTLRLPLVALSVVTCVLVQLLAERVLGDRPRAAVAAVLFAVSPWFNVVGSVTALGFYVVGQTLTVAVLYGALRAGDHRPRGPTGGWPAPGWPRGSRSGRRRPRSTSSSRRLSGCCRCSAGTPAGGPPRSAARWSARCRCSAGCSGTGPCRSRRSRPRRPRSRSGSATWSSRCSASTWAWPTRTARAASGCRSRSRSWWRWPARTRSRSPAGPGCATSGGCGWTGAGRHDLLLAVPPVVVVLYVASDSTWYTGTPRYLLVTYPVLCVGLAALAPLARRAGRVATALVVARPPRC